MTLPEVCDLIGLEIPEGEDEGEETIGGHITARLGRLAETGDAITLGAHRVVVLSMDGHRIDRVRFEEPKPADPAKQPGTEVPPS